ncbi:MAG: outer membrane beta-barrel protein, partial [Bacteroidia bacterium]|nr:outer membrane beta-barrel protein [Bacteroidia bacterium]
SQSFKANVSSSSYLNSVGDSNPSSAGSAYSAGFGISKRVFNRWVLQSGVNYINQNIGYTSNYVSYASNNQSKAFVAEYADFANQAVTITTPYQINSTIEVVSLPIQTGYLIVDRKIGWQLNTGVAADFFVRNTLTDESGQVGSFSQSSGEDSPYRTVSWAGLLGTEVSYKIAKQYRISVAPNMRYSMNSVLKSTSSNVSNPLVMDIGFRFRYIFK